MRYLTVLKTERVMENMLDLISSVEAVLFASGEPVPVSRLSLVLASDEQEIASAAAELNGKYIAGGHAMRILELDGKLQMCSAPEYAPVISKIMEQRKPPSLSAAALEALAIVAYYQPVTAAYVSKVRGVDSSYTVGSLAERGLIESKGRLEAPGRPALYGTTDVFLRTMGISSVDELPPLPDMTNVEGISKLQQQIDALKAPAEQMTIEGFGEASPGLKK